MKQKYKDINFHAKTLAMIELMDEIAGDYMASGFKLTVRQLYYQLVARDIVPNTQASYKRVATTANDARMAGLLDWDVIEDRTRYVRENAHWTSPAEIIEHAADQYMVDRRATQPIYIEAWVEKDALVGVLHSVSKSLDVPCFSCRGYPSSSALRDAAGRFKMNEHREARVILYAGDHDPSGLDIPRSIREGLRTFGVNVIVKRIALTMEQIRTYNPPPNPAKETDSRASSYMQLHGAYSWELDALEPRVLSDLYTNAVRELTNEYEYSLLRDIERADRNELYGLLNDLKTA